MNTGSVHSRAGVPKTAGGKGSRKEAGGKRVHVRKDWTCFWDWAKCSRRERHMEWWV